MTITNPTEALLALVDEHVNAANAIATEAKSALGNSAKLVKEYREDAETEDEVVQKFQKFYEQAQAKINSEIEKVNAYIKDVLKTDTWSEEVTDTKRAEYKNHVAVAREAFKAVAKMSELLGQELPTMPETLTFSGAAGKTGATGVRRLRFTTVTVNGEEVKNLSAVSQKIKSASGKSVGAADLQKAVFEAAGTENIHVIAGLGDVSFDWTETDDKGVTHTFAITVYRENDSDDESTDEESETE